MSGRSFDFDPASQPKFTSGVVAGIRADATLYPLASTWKRAGGVFSGLGARRHRRQAVLARLDARSRTRRRSSRPTSCASRAGCAGASSLYKPVPRPQLLIQAGGGLHSFAIGKDATDTDVGPADVGYKYVTLGIGAAHPLRRVGLAVGDVRLSHRVRSGTDRRRRRRVRTGEHLRHPRARRPRFSRLQGVQDRRRGPVRALQLDLQPDGNDRSRPRSPTAARTSTSEASSSSATCYRNRHVAQSAREVRQSFLEYFKKHGARGRALVAARAANDPTLLFTNAGMVQFKDVFTGRETRAVQARHVVAEVRARRRQAQRPRERRRHRAPPHVLRDARQLLLRRLLQGGRDRVRLGAAHQGLRASIRSAWSSPSSAATERRGAGRRRGARDLEEGHRLRRRAHHRPRARRTTSGRWATPGRGSVLGDPLLRRATSEAPLGKFGEEPAPTASAGSRSGTWSSCSSRSATQGRRRSTPLPKPSIDTGAGLERVTRVVQGVTSNYDTDLFAPLVARPASWRRRSTAHRRRRRRLDARHRRSRARHGVPHRRGVLPSNEGRGYVLRRVMRRAIRHGVRLGLAEGPFRLLCERVVGEMGEAYPELGERQGAHRAASRRRGGSAFRRTLERGLELLDEAVRQAAARARRCRARRCSSSTTPTAFPSTSPGHRRGARLRRRRGRLRRGDGEAARAQRRVRRLGRGGRRRRAQGARGQARRDASSSATSATTATGKIVVAARAADATRRASRARRRPDAVLRRVGRADRRHRDHRQRRVRASRSSTRRRRRAGSSCTRARSTSGTARASATRPRSPSTTSAATRSRQPLGDAPAALGAQGGARRARGAEGLARRARPAALRLRALPAADRRREAARRGPGQRRDPHERRLGDRR